LFRQFLTRRCRYL